MTNNEEMEAFAAQFYPKFMEYVARRSKNIFDCEVATSTDGLKSLPALYDKDGVRKQVVVPLDLLSGGGGGSGDNSGAISDDEIDEIADLCF